MIWPVLYFRKVLLVALLRGTQLCHPRDGKGLSHDSNSGGRGGAGVKSVLKPWGSEAD